MHPEGRDDTTVTVTVGEYKGLTEAKRSQIYDIHDSHDLGLGPGKLCLKKLLREWAEDDLAGLRELHVVKASSKTQTDGTIWIVQRLNNPDA
jgi:hypothetical protein